MTICRTYDVRGATLEQYDKVNQSLPGKPEGARFHVAGKTDDGIRVIEVWDSPEHIDRYMASGLGEALQEFDIPEPQVTDFEVHNLDWIK